MTTHLPLDRLRDFQCNNDPTSKHPQVLLPVPDPMRSMRLLPDLLPQDPDPVQTAKTTRLHPVLLHQGQGPT